MKCQLEGTRQDDQFCSWILLAVISAGACCLSPAAAQEAGQPSIIILADQRELADKFRNTDTTAEQIVVFSQGGSSTARD